MPQDEEKVKKLMQEFVDRMGLRRKVTQVVYRDDYWDYRVILDGSHHCSVREKLIDVYLKNQEEDVQREIEFLLSHPVELEEWEKEEVSEGGDYKSDSIVDDSADYDF